MKDQRLWGGERLTPASAFQCPRMHWELVQEARWPSYKRWQLDPWEGRENGILLFALAQEFQKYGTQSGPQ